MPSADKRQRKKENARAAREARLAAEKKRKRMRTGRTVAIVAVVAVAGIFAINYFQGGSSKKADSTSTTTVSTPPTTVAFPASCNSTVPKAGPKNTKQTAPPMTIDPSKTYTAKLTTSCGDVTIALDAKNAPKSVNNFVFLARQGFYDGLKWHRVASSPPIIQGGDPEGTGQGGPGYTTVVELPKDGKYPKGAVAWAKTVAAPKGSAGSQFFIDTGDASSIGDDYGYIGKVTAGQDAVDTMGTLVNPNDPNGAPSHPIYIDKVTITES